MSRKSTFSSIPGSTQGDGIGIICISAPFEFTIPTSKFSLLPVVFLRLERIRVFFLASLLPFSQFFFFLSSFLSVFLSLFVL